MSEMDKEDDDNLTEHQMVYDEEVYLQYSKAYEDLTDKRKQQKHGMYVKP